MTDDQNNAVPDPWEDLDGPESLESSGGLDFSFDEFDADEPVEEAAVLPFDAPASGADLEADVPAVSGDMAAAADLVSDPSAPEAVEHLMDDIAGWLTEPPSAGADTASLEDVPSLDIFEPSEAISDTAEAAAVAGIVGGTAFAVGEGVEAIEPVAAVAPALWGGPKKKNRGGGAVGAIIGGLLSIPIVLLILLGVLWATGRDPLNMRSFLPAVLLPAREVAVSGPVSAVDDTGAGEAAAAAEPVGDEATASGEEATSEDEAPSNRAAADSDPSAPQEPASGEGSDPADPPPASAAVPSASPAAPMANDQPAITIGEPPLAAVTSVPPVPVVDPFAEPAVPSAVPAPSVAPPEPPPLDLSGLETAVDEAVAAMDAVAADAGTETPEHRHALVAWYKQLARVGEELAMLETAAADTGRPLGETPAPILELYGRIAATDDVAPDLERLCRNWVDFSRRPADGVLLVGTLESVRQVGPFWHAAVGLKRVDGSLREVSVIARREPRASVGDRVGVAGVVFSGDVVWAADCGRLETTVEADPF